jgi:hypothetical protein
MAKPGRKPGSHIDRSTGRNIRDKSPIRGSGMQRQNGRVVNRAAQMKQKAVDRKASGR